MQWFTCGSSIEIPSEILDKFDGIVAGYFWDLWGVNKPSVFEKAEGKIVRSQFLYGNKHRKPPERCATITDWVYRRVSRFPQVEEWVLVNEFTGDSPGSYYPGYEPESVINYFVAAHEANPKARLILADFKSWHLGRWLKSILPIIEKLKALSLPIELGIQTHIKTVNAPVILNRLSIILNAYKDICPVHFIEASVWHNNLVDQLAVPGIWQELVEIALEYKVASFCPWWLNEIDESIMPTFGRWSGGSICDKNWELKYKIFNSFLQI